MMLVDIKHILKHPTSLAYNSIDISTQKIKMTDSVTNSLLTDIQDCFENMNITSNYEVSSCESSILTSEEKDASYMECMELNSHESHQSSDSFMCLKNKSEQLLENFELNVSNAKGSYLKKTVQELNKYSLKELQDLVEDLTHSVEEVSSELVQLLLENDALQQESDARNIAIEQLLKMTVKINESDLKPIQMSVILPDDDCDAE